MKLKAAVLRAPGEAMSIETLQIGALLPGEVLVKIGAAGLCHTDLEVIEGQLRYPMPIVLGHEAAGTVEGVGDGVDPGRCGQRVVLSWNPHCGRCFFCLSGQPILCDRYISLGRQAVAFDGTTKLRLGETDVHSMFYVAAFAEYAIVTAECAVTIPVEMPFSSACLLGCGVLTGVGAATHVAQLRGGETVMVIGCGAVGLSAIQGARLAGAGQIIAVDLRHSKLDLARAMGATHIVNAQTQNTLSAVQDITNGRGADCVIEAAGSGSAFRISAESCRPGGQVIWLGKVGLDEEISFRWGSLMGEKRFTRCSYGGADTGKDFAWLAALYLDGDLELDALVSEQIELENVNAGFEKLRRGETIRSVIVFND